MSGPWVPATPIVLDIHHRPETVDCFPDTGNAVSKAGIRGRSTGHIGRDRCLGRYAVRNSHIGSWNRPRFPQLVNNHEAVHTVVFHRLLIRVLQSIAVVGFSLVKFFRAVDAGQERLLVEATGTDEMSQNGVVALRDGLRGQCDALLVLTSKLHLACLLNDAELLDWLGLQLVPGYEGGHDGQAECQGEKSPSGFTLH